ncbi:MAG TPA: hypothetical protein VLJ57_10805 [Burkholderiaceae bacterium]|nr:hypothetical protein [Burkholderiaceae bacterium]
MQSARVPEKFLPWLTTAFDAFAVGAALAFGLLLFASDTASAHFMLGAWACIGVAALCWTALIRVAARGPGVADAFRANTAAPEPLQVCDVRTADREGQDGVHFCINRSDGPHEFILSRSALEGLIGGGFPSKDSMLLAFEIYQARIARTAIASLASGESGPTLLTPHAFAAVPAGATSRL